MRKRGLLVLAVVALFVLATVSYISLGKNSNLEFGELKVTTEHPFLVDGNWVNANQLKVGDELTTPDGKKARITLVEDAVDNSGFEVYNFETKEDNYVVGGVVVHNSNNAIRGQLSEASRIRLAHLLASEREMGVNIGATWPGRTEASQSVIETIVPKGGEVVEIGVGGYGSSAYRELIEAGNSGSFDVRGIDIDSRNIVPDLRKNTVLGDVMDLICEAKTTVSEADVIRNANQMVVYFEKAGREQSLVSLRSNMKEGACLIVSHNSGGPLMVPGEEGFLYQKINGKLSLQKYLYNIVIRDGLLYYGGHKVYTLVGTGASAYKSLLIEPWTRTNAFKWASEYIKEYDSMPWDEKHTLVNGEYVASDKIRIREAQLNKDVRTEVISYLKQQGYGASELGDMIAVDISLGNKIPEGLIVPEGLSP